MSLKEAFLDRYGYVSDAEKSGHFNVSCKSNKVKLEIEADVRDLSELEACLVLGVLNRLNAMEGTSHSKLIFLTEVLRKSGQMPLNMTAEQSIDGGKRIFDRFVEQGAIDPSTKLYYPEPADDSDFTPGC